jgi:peptidoglycan/LPS O-acetylase OafA/YrhL
VKPEDCWVSVPSMTLQISAPRPTAARGTATREGRRLDLDVVRGLAIVLALGWHFSKHPTGNVVLDALTRPGQVFGWAGVDLFFVLSGFLVGRLVLTEHARTGTFDGRRFTARRLLKLWPVLYLFLAVQAIAGPEARSTYLWQNALHLQNYVGTSLTHLWSLSVEEHFYLALALLFPLFARRRGSPRLLAGILVAILAGALALRFWAALSGAGDVELQWRTHFRADSLAAGVLLALISVHWPERFDALRRQRLLLAGVLALGGVWLVEIGKEGFAGSTLGYTVAYVTAAALLLLVHGAEWVPRARWISEPVAFLGRYSYGIYIWHVFAAEIAMDLLGRPLGSTEPWAVVVRYGVAVAVGYVATVVVEKPILRLRDRLLPPREGQLSRRVPTGSVPPATRPVAAS